MSEAIDTVAGLDPVRLDSLAEVASLFDRIPRLREEALCAGLARGLDALLGSVARGRGALDIAIGERLDALSSGDRAMCLGYAGIGDYARERLGIPASTAQKMARLARGLRECPLLRDAVRSGEVSIRQAEAVLPVARGEAEQWWVARARRETVRALKAAVKDAVQPEDDEPWARLCVEVAPEDRPVVDEALEVAGQLLGATTPKWRRIEALCEEYLSDHPGEEGATALPIDDWMEHAREWLEQESARWSFLTRLPPVAVAEPIPDVHADPRELHGDLLRLRELRARWDEVFGHLAMLFLRMRAWQLLEFASLDHYAEERLGMCGRAVQQRASLERRLEDLPSLREALCERRVSYEQARLIARYAEEGSANFWIERAGQMSCVALRAALQTDDEVKTCARGDFAAVVPLRIRSLLRSSFAAVRSEAGRWLEPGECLVRIAEHFLKVWRPLLAGRSTLQKKILARDRGRCQVPGCSRAAAHAHHVEFRSAGGSDEPENLVSLCAAHHLRGVHMGRIRVRGTAPDGLHWELGVRPGMAPVVAVPPSGSFRVTAGPR